MPSKDTVPFRITKNTRQEIELTRVRIAREQGIPLERVTLKQAEIVLRLKSQRGKILEQQIKDVLLGKIK